MGLYAGVSGIWIPQKTLQELEHMPREEILSVDKEIEYLLNIALSMATYFEKKSLVAAIELALEMNESKNY